jgi:hypothetical protein
MNDSIRHIVIFTSMLGIGTLLIFSYLPLLFILLLVGSIGLLLQIFLSPVPMAELKSVIPNLKKISFIKRRKERRKPLKMEEQAPAKAKKQEPTPIIKEKKRGLSLHIGSMISSFKALGSVLAARKKTERKNVDEIDKLLDEMISDKVNLSNHEFNANMMKESAMPSAMPLGGSAGGEIAIQPFSRPEDPFLSLSSDELETGLLDSLNDDEDATGIASGSGDTAPAAEALTGTTSAGLAMSEPDIPIPPQEVSSEVKEILEEKEPDLEEFSPLEDTDAIEENLGELDIPDTADLGFGDVLVGEKTGSRASASPTRPAGQGDGGRPAASAQAQPSLDVIPVPVEKTVDPGDMTAFTALVDSDKDMLKSLVGDVKTARKTQNVSLLRELKDFQEPAKEIESELTEIYAALNTTVKRKRKTKSS